MKRGTHNNQGASELLPHSRDINSGLLGLTGDARKMIFGKDDGGDTLAGGVNNDYLYGMGGDDAIDGGKGDDHLEGNTGNDTLAGGEGRDTLIGGSGNDLLEGGKGSNTLMGGLGDDTEIALTGGQSVAPNVWQQESNGETFWYILVDWTEGGETYQRLSIQGPDGGVFIKDWNAGKLGITPPGSETQEPPPAGAPEVRSESSAWHGAEHIVVDGSQLDALGNLITDPGQADPGRQDTFYDSTGDDQIESLAGDDTIRATRGGNDLLDASAGDDWVEAGDGNDGVIGGDDRDRLFGQGGDDRMNGGSGHDLVSGGAGNDILFGGRGNDQLDGGEDHDLLCAGAGNDAVYARAPTLSSDASEGPLTAANIPHASIAAESLDYQMAVSSDVAANSQWLMNNPDRRKAA